MSRYFFCCLFIILSLSATPSITHAESLRIGYIGAFSGDAAIIGSEISRSLEVIASQTNSSGGINGQLIELVFEDDGYDVARSLLAYEKLKGSINSHVIFMSTYGALFALGKRPELDNILVVDTLDCNDAIVKVSSMHTCIATRTESIGEGIARSIENRGGGTVGILYEEEAWFNFIVESLRRSNKSALVEVPAPVSASDYRSELLRLKARGLKHLIFLGNDSMGRAMAEARRIGITAQFYSIAGVMSPGFQSLAGKALEGTIVSNWLVPANEQYSQFAKEFENKHQKPIQLASFAGPTADAGTLIFNAMRKISPQHINARILRAALTRQRTFQGISGLIKMDPDGAVRSILETTFRFENGNLIPE